MKIRIILKFISFMESLLPRISRDRLVKSLVNNILSLELGSGEFVELAPLHGVFGPFKICGNGLPIFEYIVFEEDVMEFIKVRAEISLPSRVEFLCRIESTTAPADHGKIVKTKDLYCVPFFELTGHLVRYFPLYVTPERRARNMIGGPK